MRYLIIGDIHGNLPALEKLLRKERNNYDQIISHGDVVNYGPWSNECVALLDSIPDMVKLKGNHEDYYLKGAYPGENIVAKSFFEFCYPNFTEKASIRKYQEECFVKNYKIKHTINDSYFYPDSDLSQLNLEHNYIIGHSHHQFDRVFNNYRLINTGSLGQNRKFINVAEYVIYDENEDFVELKSFIYDIGSVIDKMKSENYPKICMDYYESKARKQ